MYLDFICHVTFCARLASQTEFLKLSSLKATIINEPTGIKRFTNEVISYLFISFAAFISVF